MKKKTLTHHDRVQTREDAGDIGAYVWKVVFI